MAKQVKRIWEELEKEETMIIIYCMKKIYFQLIFLKNRMEKYQGTNKTQLSIYSSSSYNLYSHTLRFDLKKKQIVIIYKIHTKQIHPRIILTYIVLAYIDPM